MTMFNKEMQNNRGQTFIVLDEMKIKKAYSEGYHTQLLIQFKDTGTTGWVYYGAVISGQVDDPHATIPYGLAWY